MSSSSLSSPNNRSAKPRGSWQGERPGGDWFGGLRGRLVQLFWGVLLLSALILFAWLVWLLLLAPKRTPLIVLSAAPYSWPLPPNAWAAEDFDHLGVMDGETITIRGQEDPVFRKADFLERLDKEIEQVQKQSPKLPLVVWVSLHGVADSTGETIHLIPPKASPTDPASWIELDELLGRIQKVTPQRNALLILDCNRMQVNWNIGLLANQFAEK